MTIFKVVIQAGHVNRGGGAPEELANNLRITNRVCQMLRDRKFEVYQADANADTDPKVIGTDWNLFLALHCDMDYVGDNGSGFADYCDPASDGNTAESQRICKIINDNYFKEVGIKYISHSNKNTRFYYVWDNLTAKTPCVLLEMGQSIDPHDSVLLGNTELISGGIVRSICKAFNVSYETTVPPVVTPPTPVVDVVALEKSISDLKVALQTEKTNSQTKLLLKETECQAKQNTYKDKIIQFINSI